MSRLTAITIGRSGCEEVESWHQGLVDRVRGRASVTTAMKVWALVVCGSRPRGDQKSATKGAELEIALEGLKLALDK